MTTIGFGGTFYTLWSVKTDLISLGAGISYNKITCTYFKNLSKDLNEAIIKAKTDNFDENLKGKKSSFEYKTQVVIEPKLITEAETLYRIIFVNDKENLVEGIREEVFERCIKLGHLTECSDEEGVFFQWNGKLRTNCEWESKTLHLRFKGIY